MITDLAKNAPALYQAFQDDLRKAEGESHFMRNSGKYPLCGRGDINVYTVFAELNRALTGPGGRIGCIVPSGIATDDTTKYFFQDIVETNTLANLYDFENRNGLFAGVHRSYKFCLLTLRTPSPHALLTTHYSPLAPSDFVFFALHPDDLREPDRHFALSAEDIALLNPNTRTCPIFRSKADAELTKAIYRRVPVFRREISEENGSACKIEAPWAAEITRTFDMARFGTKARTLSSLEREGLIYQGSRLANKEEWVPILESKTFWHFDHRAATYANVEESEAAKGNCRELCESEKQSASTLVLGRYYLPKPIVDQYTAFYNKPYWLAYRNITNTTNERTFVGTILPRHSSDYTVRLIFGGKVEGILAGCLIASLDSDVFDYVARQSIAGTNLSDYLMKQLPVPPPNIYSQSCIWINEAQTLCHFLLPRVLELTYTAWDLEPFAQDCGWKGPPFRWDEERRFLLRCELDAAFFHLYLPAGASGEWRVASREDGCPYDETPEQLAELKKHFPTPRHAVDYIMDTFPIVKRKDEAAYGHYRTKDTILDIYDAMQRAIATGEPYQTRLDPPPADPRCCHPPKGGAK
ncbi:MAG: hypothetical protein BWX80_03702 [Candidatus Hydrogenedentes bacterium ADurb.Bin101]|nr:MAG: hypothetical protein BWX80_03702 [Candidatus Hydrogenedentes bacterium ADurb.Bin101]